MRSTPRRGPPLTRARRQIPSLLLLFIVVAWTSTGQAGPRRGARLAWARGEAASSCVGAMGLVEDVKRRLGWDPFEPPSELEIEGTAARTRSGFRAELSFRDRNGKPLGTRHFELAGDCRALGEMVAVAIAVAVDPDAPAAPPSVVLEPPPDAPEPPVPEPLAPPVVAQAVRARLSTSAGGALGLVPGLGASVAVGAGVALADRLELAIGGVYLPPSREGAFSFGMAIAKARACALPWGARGLVRFCGAALGGAFESYSHAVDLVPIEMGASAWLGVEVGGVASVPLHGPLRLELGLGGIVPLTRRSGFIRGSAEPVWEQGVVAIGADAGLALLF